tara:strand:+ start:31033 stop:32400 length:1368 start_codon:yes stop_codon:yes gene_type:complete
LISFASNLFFKVFLGFWLITLVILASWVITTHYYEDRPTPEQGAPQQHGPPHRIILRAIYNLQNVDDAALPALLTTARSRHGFDLYLVNANGKDFLNRDLPALAARALGDQQGSRRRGMAAGPNGRAIAHTVVRPDQRRLRAVFVFPARMGPWLGTIGSSPWLRIVLAVIVSGLLCFGLSRLLTRRLKALQQAAREIAQGKLETRVQVRAHGGDETDELARNFNSMATQLQQRIADQKRLLRDVSHELRSPLARLRVALALAQDPRTPPATQLQRIEQETTRLEELIGQLLATQSQHPAMEDPVDLVVLLKKLSDDTSFEGQSRGKRAEFNSSCNSAIIASSHDMLHKCFENLLRNALAHAPDNSEIKVSLAHSPDTWRVTIEDRGPGVPADDLDKIFDAFYRVDSARARETGGHGLGLAIAASAVTQHNGSITADNTGNGLRVTIVLPRTQATT